MKQPFKKMAAAILVGMLIQVSDLTAMEPTAVQGPITTDATWGVKNSPYLVSEDLIVENGATLTIEPGVEVRFLETVAGDHNSFSTPNTDLIIRGTLTAMGTGRHPIRFVLAGSGQNWGAIYFAQGSSEECILKNCFISKGRVICNYASPVIENCDLVEGGGIEVAYLAQPHIAKNRILRNTNGVTAWFYSSKLDLQYNVITENQNGLYIKGFEQASVNNNLIYKNVKYDVYHVYPKNILLSDNWWGSSSLERVRERIYDHSAEKRWGVVAVEPLARSIEVALATPLPTETPTPQMPIIMTPIPVNTETPVPLPKPPKGLRRGKVGPLKNQPTATPTPDEQGLFKSNW